MSGEEEELPVSTQNWDPSYEVYSHLTHNVWKWWGTFGFGKTQAILLLTEMLLASVGLWRGLLLGSALSWSDLPPCNLFVWHTHYSYSSTYPYV